MKTYLVNQPQHNDQSSLISPSFTKPVWQDQQMACDQCQYNGQDIDTFPCAKCHTRV